MKKNNEPLSVERINFEKNKDKSKKILLFTMIPFFPFVQNFSNTANELEVYNKMNIIFNDIQEIEYGTEFNSMDLVEEIVIGEVISYDKIDTNKLGTTEITYIVSKGNIQKEISTAISVVDTKGADINIEKDNISIYVGNDYDITNNIISVVDNVDGELSYVLNNDELDKGYYTITTDFDKNKVGKYSVNIKAIDKRGNISEKSYTIEVNKKYYYPYTKANISSSVDTSSVVSMAYSFLGYNYVHGGASPNVGFDCTGLVYYIYGYFGKKVGRSTSNIVYSGVGVDPNNMIPGDIIVWSTYSNNYPTHAAIYVGNGMMIHAANYNDGVILSSVSTWASWGSHIVSVRRV